MKNLVSQAENISCRFICAAAAVILAAFTYWAGVYTHMTYVELENLKVRLYEDSIMKNIGCMTVALVVLFFLGRLIFSGREKENKKRLSILAICITVTAGIFAMLWCILLKYEPVHDQLQVVSDAFRFLEGDYSDLKEYLETYPHQIGLVFLYEILFSIWPDHEAIYYVHVLWLMLIVYFTYKITEELFKNDKASFLAVLSAVCFVPLYFYVNYAYGDLCMAMGAVVGTWCLIRFCKTERIRYMVLLLFVMTISCLARKNTLIVMIAMAIVLLLSDSIKKRWQRLLMPVLILAVPLSICKGVTGYYEHKAQVDMVEGAPAVLHIAMGMQDVYEGPGYYNAYNLMTYVNCGKDADASAKIAKEYIRDRVFEMSQDLDYTRDFYLLKIWQQWNEPSFSGELSTKTFSESGKLAQSIYYGNIQQFLRSFRNYYLFVLYAGAFLAAVCMFVFEKKSMIWKNGIWIAFIGGVLFSLLWENKSRYTMTYVVMLIPYSAYGLYRIQYAVQNTLCLLRKGK